MKISLAKSITNSFEISVEINATNGIMNHFSAISDDVPSEVIKFDLTEHNYLYSDRSPSNSNNSESPTNMISILGIYLITI